MRNTFRFPVQALALLLLASLLPWLGGCASNPAPAAPAPLRVMTFNIHHGAGLDGRVDLPRIAEVIRQAGADVVGLQEVDRLTQRTGRRDFPAELAALTGMTCVFSTNLNLQGGHYGNAVLTRLPVKQAQNHHFRMTTGREARGLQQLTLDVHGRELTLLNTHLDYATDDGERWSSVGEIAALVKTNGQGAILLCGDFNAVPDSRVIKELGTVLVDSWRVAGAGEGLTMPAEGPKERIDYIWVGKDGPLAPRRAWIPQTAASDHLPLVVELEWKAR